MSSDELLVLNITVKQINLFFHKGLLEEQLYVHLFYKGLLDGV